MLLLVILLGVSVRGGSFFEHNASFKGQGPFRSLIPAAAHVGADEGRAKEFRLLTWNILAPSWTEGFYTAKGKDNWFSRFPRIMQELRIRKPDIIALQEVESLIWEEGLEGMFQSRGYQGLYVESRDSQVGVAILWRKHKFRLGQSTNAELGDPQFTNGLESVFASFGALQKKRYLAQPRSALIVVLEPILSDVQVPSGSKPNALLIAAAHLQNTKHDGTLELPLNLDVQLFQACMLLEAIDFTSQSAARHYASLSTIVAGDFNVPAKYPLETLTKMKEAVQKGKTVPVAASEPSVLPSPVYELLTRGRLSAHSMGLLLTSIKAASFHPSTLLTRGLQDLFASDWSHLAMASSTFSVLGSEPPTSERHGTLDYIFFSSPKRRANHRRPARLMLLGILGPPVALPADMIATMGSDHWPQLADFALVLQGAQTTSTTTPALQALLLEVKSMQSQLSTLLALNERLETKLTKLEEKCMPSQ